MPRLEGEKQSVLPYILGIALVAAIGAGAYFYTQNNQENSAANNTTESITRPIPATENSVSENSATENTATDNSMTDNSATENAMPSGAEMGNSATENAATNSVPGSAPTTSVNGGSSP